MSYPNTVSSLPGTLGTDWWYLVKPHRSVSGDTNGLKATIPFRTTYANHIPFLTQVFYYTATITSSWGSFSRVFHLQHPEYPSLYASGFKMEATGNSGGTTAYGTMFSDVRIEVEFTNPPYGFAGDTAFSTWEVDQGSTYTTHPGRKFKFGSGEPLDQDAGTFAVLNSYVLTIFNAPVLNDSVMDTLSGRVNNASFMGRAAGSLLFGGCKSTFQNNLGGTVSYQKSLSFTYRSYSWNQAFRSDGVLDTPTDPAGNGLYNTGTFTDLFN